MSKTANSLKNNAIPFVRKNRIKYFISQINTPSNNIAIPKFFSKFKPESEWNPLDLPADYRIEQFIAILFTTLKYLIKHLTI